MWQWGSVWFEDSLLDEFLQVIEPHQVLPAIFVYHVLMQEIRSAGLDASDWQILMEGFLQVLIQIPSENTQRKIDLIRTESQLLKVIDFELFGSAPITSVAILEQWMVIIPLGIRQGKQRPHYPGYWFPTFTPVSVSNFGWKMSIQNITTSVLCGSRTHSRTYKNPYSVRILKATVIMIHPTAP